MRNRGKEAYAHKNDEDYSDNITLVFKAAKRFIQEKKQI
jgi:hypothetical protein